MNVKIMAHMIAYYPSPETSIDFARGLIDGGAAYLEVQFPFSDPTADGVFIQEASTCALKQGFTLKGGFKLIEKIKKFTRIPVFIMSYANMVYFHGVENFTERCAQAGIKGLIIPDLPPDYDEGLYLKAEQKGLMCVPVLAISMKKERMNKILSRSHNFVYAILRKGITGEYTRIGEENINFLKEVSSSGSKTLAGFGISKKEQVMALAPYTHAVVVGSAFISSYMKNQKNGNTDCYSMIYNTMKSLQH